MTKKQFNALKRLERVGDENSKASLKLKEACAEVGKYLKSLVPNNVVSSTGTSAYNNCYLHISNFKLCYNTSKYKSYDICDQENLSIDTCFKFAQHVANGLIDDFETWAEKHNIKKDVNKK
jgi:hypothetical protein